MISAPSAKFKGRLNTPNSLSGNIAEIVACVVMVYSGLITADGLSGDNNIFFELGRFELFNIFILDFLAFAFLAVVLISGGEEVRLAVRRCAPFLLGSALAIVSGAIGARVSGYPRVGFLGHEVRGLIDWAILILCFSYVCFRNPPFVVRLLKFTTAICLLRCAIEIFYIRSEAGRFGFSWVVDSSVLLVAAILAVIWSHLFLFRNEGKVYSLVLSLVFLVIVAVGFRRSSMVIAVTGEMLVVMNGLFVYRRAKPVFAAGLILALIVGAAAATGKIGVVQDALTTRFMGVFEEGSRTASDIEHWADMEDALSVIKDQPLWGAGMATGIPFRTMDRYGSLLPFHSSYYHTWVRLGLVGFVLYLALALWLLRNSFRRGAFVTGVGIPCGLGAASLVIFLVKFPPFYLDHKLIPMIAFCVAALIADRLRASPPRPQVTGRGLK